LLKRCKKKMFKLGYVDVEKLKRLKQLKQLNAAITSTNLEALAEAAIIN
jgi:hypothetical protein